MFGLVDGRNNGRVYIKSIRGQRFHIILHDNLVFVSSKNASMGKLASTSSWLIARPLQGLHCLTTTGLTLLDHYRAYIARPLQGLHCSTTTGLTLLDHYRAYIARPLQGLHCLTPPSHWSKLLPTGQTRDRLQVLWICPDSQLRENLVEFPLPSQVEGEPPICDSSQGRGACVEITNIGPFKYFSCRK
ncbi:hypothetical protein RRG08_051715 [Elysia crispata]|uniref:Uncharacterized protein n=1 Tax=Elysia crispata TaxID=231223 RepID=A0AAE1BBT0_9GAST|nr:hypothetical protein RRG08_051715 [Elysia crispata]